jgi:hypothetical protein
MCRESRLRCFRPEVLRDADYAADELIEPEETD